MSRASRIYFSSCAALIGFALFYALPIYARLPRPFYDPIKRVWTIASQLGPIPMGYVGQLCWALGGALACGGVAALITSRLKAEPGERAWTLWAAWALTAVAVVGGYFTWNNWP